MERTLYTSMNAQNLEELIAIFYPKVLKDPTIGPFFIEKLGNNIESPTWKKHLVDILEFWKMSALGYDDYEGNPLAPHFNIKGINREAFSIWLKLFDESIDEVYEPFAGDYLKEKSKNIAENFMKKLEL